METTITKSNMYRQTGKLLSACSAVPEKQAVFECGICYYQNLAKNFTPITVSANFAALECPNCLNNDSDSFHEAVNTYKQAA